MLWGKIEKPIALREFFGARIDIAGKTKQLQTNDVSVVPLKFDKAIKMKLPPIRRSHQSPRVEQKRRRVTQ